MYKVLLIIDAKKEVLFRQIPDGQLVLGNCHFYLNDEISNPDFVFFFDQCPKDYYIYVNPKNTCLITGEPPSVKFYSKTYTKQFNWVLSCQKNVYKRSNGLHSFPFLPWLVGIRQIGSVLGEYKCDSVLDYNYFINHNQKNNVKGNRIAVITSNKRITKGHRKRLDYIEKLSELLPNTIDVYGNGFKTIEDKYDVYRQYKYLLIIENCQYPNYWTEKLADAFLSNCFPLYIGAPNVYDYFSKESLLSLNYNVQESVKLIKHVMDADYYNSHFDSIVESKMKILNEYNIFPRLVDFVNKYYVCGEKVNISFNRYKSDVLSKIFWRLYKYLNVEL